MDESPKLDDYLNKYKDKFGLVEAKDNMKIPEQLSFMKKYADNPEIMKWLRSLLVNGKKETIYANLDVMFGDDRDYSEEKVLSYLRDMWIIECLN